MVWTEAGKHHSTPRGRVEADDFIHLLAIGHLVFSPRKRTLFPLLPVVLFRWVAEKMTSVLTKAIQLGEHSLTLYQRSRAPVAGFFNSNSWTEEIMNFRTNFLILTFDNHVRLEDLSQAACQSNVTDMTPDRSWLFLFYFALKKVVSCRATPQKNSHKVMMIINQSENNPASKNSCFPKTPIWFCFPPLTSIR